MLESTFREDWDEIGSNRAKKAIWCLKVPFFRSLPGVNGLSHMVTKVGWDARQDHQNHKDQVSSNQDCSGPFIHVGTVTYGVTGKAVCCHH